jgi:glutathione peroxidase
MASLHDFTAETLEGRNQSLADYRGKVALVVNVASRCGFTPQYTGLEALWKEYADRGLVILGFPCNQFGAQEPGDAAQIREFCSLTYPVSFPMFAKVEVNGERAHPLYSFLKSAAPGVLGTEAVKWNFTKFLVGKDGRVAGRYAPTTKPAELRADIEKLLAE